MEVGLLGPLEVVTDAGPVVGLAGKERAVLAVLALHAGQSVPLAELAAALWGDDPPRSAHKAVQTYVFRLRRMLTAGAITTVGDGYALAVSAEDVDVGRFERLVGQARRFVADRDFDGATRDLVAGLGLWRGRALVDLVDQPLGMADAARLEEMRRGAEEDLIEARLRLGEHHAVVADIESLVAAEPLRERRWAQLMLALYRCGRQADALRAYRRLREWLGEELGIEPSAELAGLEGAILLQKPELGWSRPDAASFPERRAVQPDVRGPEPGAEPGRRALPNEVVTFLFTDLEGSTRIWEDHPEAMREALARHDLILDTAIEGHGGRVIKSMGDGVCAVFADTSAAVAAAVDAMRGLASETWGATGPLLVRMGIHTGTADERDGDYFGPTLNRTGRLTAAAHGGQVVLSNASADRVRVALPDDLALVDLGEHRLKGLARRERVHGLAIAGLRSEFPPLMSLDAFPGALALPEPSFGRREEALAGRSSELNHLEQAWQHAAQGAWDVMFMRGEPGIGKTRLAGELARRVHAEGAVVLYGRCDEETIVPYQPFVEALRPCVAAYPPSMLREQLHGLEQDLARVFPKLSDRVPEPRASLPGDPEAGRYRLFEAITTLLTGITATDPTMLVLDDLHWADKPTLLLLRHLVRSPPRGSLLIVACYRDVELTPDHPLADLLADLRREPFVTSMTLAGLSEDESGELVKGLAGQDVAAPVIVALHAETGGNPFFTEELLRHLMETDALTPLDPNDRPVDIAALDLPESVREVVYRRLRRLPRSVTDLLEVAAVFGHEFDPSLLAVATGEGLEAVLEMLDLATAAGLVLESPRRMGCAFSHAVIRQTVTGTLGRARRAQLHGRVGSVKEQANRNQYSAAELARHFTEAVPVQPASKAIEYATFAGYEALADFAFEDAVAHFDTALQILDHYDGDDADRRVELLTIRASALAYVDEPAAVEAALHAVDAARMRGSPTRFAQAVAVAVEPTYGVVGHAHEIVGLIDEALALLGDGDPGLRARLLAFEAFKYATYQLHGRHGRPLAVQAVQLARDAGDPVALAEALFSLAVTLEDEPDLTQRLAIGDELLNIGRAARGRASAYGLRVLAGAYLELGDDRGVSSMIAELARIGDELKWLPAKVYAAQWRATQALLQGRFDDVRAAGQELRHHARAYRGASSLWFLQSLYLGRETGELGVAKPDVQLEITPGQNALVSATLALAELEAGHAAGARQLIDRVLAGGLAPTEIGSGRGSVLGMLAEVTVSVDATEYAEPLYDALAPFEGRVLCTVLGLACLGAADRYLGMLATLRQRWTEADDHFSRALEIENRLGGRALVARSRYWQARLLRARGGRGNGRKAEALLASVVEDASRLGMARLGAQAEELGRAGGQLRRR